LEKVQSEIAKKIQEIQADNRELYSQLKVENQETNEKMYYKKMEIMGIVLTAKVRINLRKCLMTMVKNRRRNVFLDNTKQI
jgi:hypothetical protein